MVKRNLSIFPLLNAASNAYDCIFINVDLFHTHIVVFLAQMNAKEEYYVMPKMANFGEFSSVLETTIFGVCEIVVLPNYPQIN